MNLILIDLVKIVENRFSTALGVAELSCEALEHAGGRESFRRDVPREGEKERTPMKAVVHTLVAIFGLGMAAQVDAAERQVAGDLARLQGRWVTRAGPRHKIVVCLNIEGNKATVDVTTPQGVKFNANGELRIDESVSPHTLDWVGFTGLDSQELPDIPAIYRIEGESFQVCNGGPNSPRPLEFKPGENILADVHVFERDKPSEGKVSD